MGVAIPRDPQSSGVPPDFIKAAVPLLFGTLFNWALYGALCVQIYVYTYNFPQDKLTIKLVAYLVFLIEMAQTILSGADAYYWFIDGFGNFDQLRQSHYSPIDLPIIHAVISFIVQQYFCYRIWVLTRARDRRSSWLCIVIAVMSTVQAAGAAWGGIASLVIGKYLVAKEAFYMWAVASILADVLIAIGMTMIFRQARVTAGRFTNSALLRLVRLTVETNALTTAVAFLAFTLFITHPNEIYYTFPIGIIGKMYSNTLLVSLNNRIYFRDHASPMATVHGEASDHGVGSNASRTPIAVHVTQVQVKQPSSQKTITGDGFEMGVISHIKEDMEMEKGNGRCSIN